MQITQTLDKTQGRDVYNVFIPKPLPVIIYDRILFMQHDGMSRRDKSKMSLKDNTCHDSGRAIETIFAQVIGRVQFGIKQILLIDLLDFMQ